MLKRSVESPTGYFGIELKTGDERKMSPVEKHTLQWKQVIEQIRIAAKNLQKNQYLEMKYEDFIKDPSTCLSNITKFCELPSFDYKYKKEPFMKKIKNKIPFLRKEKDSGWELRKNLVKIVENRNRRHKNDKEIINYSDDLLQQLGYL